MDLGTLEERIKKNLGAGGPSPDSTETGYTSSLYSIQKRASVTKARLEANVLTLTAAARWEVINMHRQHALIVEDFQEAIDTLRRQIDRLALILQRVESTIQQASAQQGVKDQI
jgi:hypothetical protein